MEFYAKGYTGSRSGWFGYLNSTAAKLAVSNSLGEVHINPSSGNFVFKAMGSHSGIQAAGKAHLKWLSSSDTIQVRNSADTAYGTLQAIISNASDRRLKRNIVEAEDSFLERVLSTTVYRYNMEGYPDDKVFLGVIADEVPEDIVIKAASEDQYDGINLYGMIAFLWKAVQELAQKVELIERGGIS